ncbi:unnamed protein product [Adineta ricciae]|uniref:Uncharacterized protein n=1 Tax=Adineta ricciae TaxID=249248 RepID=A0A813T275_ADIRI|nr:unnamed protein product [Adineta ricciae]
MTSRSRSFDPYTPQYIDSRVEDPVLVPSTHDLFSRSITAASNYEQFSRTPSTTIEPHVIRNRGLPDTVITDSVQSRRDRNILRDPVGQNIPRSITHDNYNFTKQSTRTLTHPVPNQDNKPVEIDKLQTNYANTHLPRRNQLQAKTIEPLKKQRPPKPAEDVQPTSGYWKAGTLFNSKGIVAIGPIVYDEDSYAGPFGLNRVGSYIFYIGMGVFTLLAGIFLLMTAVFYNQKYPDPNTNAGTLAGVVVCAFAFYLGFQLILIGLYTQKYRQEHPKKRIPHKKPRLVYTPFGYYLYPQYFAEVNEQLHMQGYGLSNSEQNVKPEQTTKPVEVKPVKHEVKKPETRVEVSQQSVAPPQPEFYFLQSILADSNEMLPTVAEKVDVTSTTEAKKTTEKSSTETNQKLKKTNGLLTIENKTVPPMSTNHHEQVSVTRRIVMAEPRQTSATPSTIVKSNEATAGELSRDNIYDDYNNAADRRIKTRKNRISSSKLASNAFYNDYDDYE